ncbi:MAG: hypothetical protein ACOYN5_12640 [Bacteroidales bacterium]
MKNKTWIVVILFLLMQNGVFAQTNNGDTLAPEVKKEKVEEPKQKSKRHIKQKIRHFAYLMPSMSPEADYNYGPFKTEAAPKYGFMIETGAIRYFSDNFMIKEKANIGLYHTFGFGASFQNFALPETFNGFKSPFLFADFKLGPDFRFEVNENVKFDLYGNIGALISYGGAVYDTDKTTIYLPLKPAIALQTGVGLNVALKRFVIGGQMTFANGKFNFDITEDAETYGSTAPDEVNFDYKVSLNSLRLHIGYYLRPRN